MGPITLFDKSALQALSIDEAVWFDQFFLPVICPLFFVETLADLEKSIREGRTPEEEVGLIAVKTPQMNGHPNVDATDLGIANLLGQPVVMDGRPVIAGGNPVRIGDRTGINFDLAPEAEAFIRWQNGEFLEVERRFAATWRHNLAVISFDKVFDKIVDHLKRLGLIQEKCRTLEEVKSIANAIVTRTDRPRDVLTVACSFLNVPQEVYRWIFKRAADMGYPSLAEFAPYAAYVLTTDLFFFVAVNSSLISKERVTNRVDISYLKYLPFCNVFTSGDRLHKRCAPLFLREDQQFLWGPDLKQELQKIDEYYSQLPEEEKEKGLFAIAPNPPEDDSFLVTRLWDLYLPRWRSNLQNKINLTPEEEASLIKQVKEMRDAKPVSSIEQYGVDFKNPENLSLQAKISHRRGKWWQVSKDLEIEDSENAPL
jgi:hypothetical protein